MQPTKKKTKAKPMPKHQAEKVKRIAVAVAKNPQASERDIAEDTWIAKSTVHDNIGHIGQIKEKWLEDLLSVDMQIMQSSTKEINRRINDEEEKKQIKATDLSTIAQHSADRYMKFKGTVTDESWWLKDIDWDNTPIADLIKLIKAK